MPPRWPRSPAGRKPGRRPHRPDDGRYALRQGSEPPDPSCGAGLDRRYATTRRSSGAPNGRSIPRSSSLPDATSPCPFEWQAAAQRCSSLQEKASHVPAAPTGLRRIPRRREPGRISRPRAHVSTKYGAIVPSDSARRRGAAPEKRACGCLRIKPNATSAPRGAPHTWQRPWPFRGG